MPATTVTVTAGAAPATIETITSQPSRRVATRRAEVPSATRTISTMNPAVAHHERSTAVMSSDTTASFRIARTEAVITARLTPSRPINAAAAATTMSTASTTASAGSTSTVP